MTRGAQTAAFAACATNAVQVAGRTANRGAGDVLRVADVHRLRARRHLDAVVALRAAVARLVPGQGDFDARVPLRAAVAALEPASRAPRGVGLSETIAVLVAELSANAATHGRVAGRDFALTLSLRERAQTLRVDLADTRAEAWPATAPPAPAGPDAEAGRGLLLVDALATRWGVAARVDGPGKIVWAELDVTPFRAASSQGR